MAGHLLGVLEPSVVLQVNRDASRPPGVTSDGREKTRRLGPFPNRSPGVVTVKSSSGHCRSKGINALEQGLPTLEACGDNVLVQYLLQQVMHGHLLLLAAFFVESQPATRTIVIVIVDFEFQYRADPGESVGKDTKQSAIPEAGVRGCLDRVKKLLDFTFDKCRRFAFGPRKSLGLEMLGSAG
jgi:hypothetical protein